MSGNDKVAVYAHAARVSSLASASTIDDLAANELMALVNARAPDNTVFNDRPPFFWRAEISSGVLDAYFTRMANSSLTNYAADLGTGVAFQNSHRWAELGWGQSISGTRVPDGAVHGWFYTIPRLSLNGVNTDDFIAGVRAGLVRDVSIGFYGGRFVCSICGKDMLTDWECHHIPGIEYPLNDTVSQLAIAIVEDARLSEVSAVYDGATPGAAILKATSLADQNIITPQARALIEQRYRVSLPTRSYQMHPVSSPQLTTTPLLLPLEEPVTDVDAQLAERANTTLTMEALVADLRRDNQELANELHAARVSLEQMESRANGLAATLEEATRRASEAETSLRSASADIEAGKQYRTDLINELIVEGVRALGERFNEPVYLALVQSAPLQTIKQIRDDFRVQADALFTGGRKTPDSDPKPDANDGNKVIPSGVYRTS